MDAAILQTRIVRWVVVSLAMVTYTFTTIKSDRLDKIFLLSRRKPRPPSPQPQTTNASPTPESAQATRASDYSSLASALNLSHLTYERQNRLMRLDSRHLNELHCKQSLFGQTEARLVRQRCNLPDIDRQCKLAVRLVLAFQCVNLVQQLLVMMLKFNFAKRLRPLDCFILGRLALNGRVVKFMNALFVSGTLTLLGWPLVMLLGEPKFHFDVLEFLLCDYNYLLARDQQPATRRRWPPAGHSSRRRPSWGRKQLLKSLLEFQCEFAADANIRVLGRPNRTSQAWLQLSRIAVASTLVAYAGVLLLLVAVVGVALPLTLTRSGFILEHGYCVDWLLEQRKSSPPGHERRFSFIVELPENYTAEQRANAEGQFLLPWRDPCPASLYTALRLGYSVLLNLVFYLSCANYLVANAIISALISADLYLYSRALRLKLAWLVSELRLVAPGPTSDPLAGGRLEEASSGSSSVRPLLEAIGDAQALVVDYFALVNRYRPYVSVFSAFSVLTWIAYSMLISSWIFLPGPFHSANKLEWYAIHACGSLNTLLVICSFAFGRHSSLSVYGLIASAAALDRVSGKAQRLRWASLTCYYRPVPMYCFKLAKSIELSWLFLFKLFAWLLSAFLVVSTFYPAPGGGQFVPVRGRG